MILKKTKKTKTGMCIRKDSVSCFISVTRPVAFANHPMMSGKIGKERCGNDKGTISVARPLIYCWSVCAKPEKYLVLYLCVKDINWKSNRKVDNPEKPTKQAHKTMKNKPKTQRNMCWTPLYANKHK